MTKYQGFTPWGPHHWLWGIIIQAVGFYGIFNWPVWLAVLLTGLGLYVTLDDVYQHIRQRWQPWYCSPLHRGYWVVLNWLIDHCPGGGLRRFLEWMKQV